ncbi:MAG: hypothetical protein AB1668_07455 [Nanoarchaeota archaeon]
MDATAVIFDLKGIKNKNKTQLRRKVFGYHDISNHGNYSYQREGLLSPYVKEKWGKGVIIIKRAFQANVERILKEHKVNYKLRNVKLS